MKDEHTYCKIMARNGHNMIIYKGTFVSNQSLAEICIRYNLVQIKGSSDPKIGNKKKGEAEFWVQKNKQQLHIYSPFFTLLHFL